MGFYNKFLREIDEKETKTDTKVELIENKELGNDNNNVFKITCSWLVGGIISLMPTFTFILSNYSKFEKKVLTEFFSNKDLFLVITTLTVSALFEYVFSNASYNIIKYLIISLGILLTVLNMHIFTILQYGHTIPYLPVIGEILLCICIIVSIVGYYAICKKRGDR